MNKLFDKSNILVDSPKKMQRRGVLSAAAVLGVNSLVPTVGVMSALIATGAKAAEGSSIYFTLVSKVPTWDGTGNELWTYYDCRSFPTTAGYTRMVCYKLVWTVNGNVGLSVKENIAATAAFDASGALKVFNSKSVVVRTITALELIGSGSGCRRLTTFAPGYLTGSDSGTRKTYFSKAVGTATSECGYQTCVMEGFTRYRFMIREDQVDGGWSMSAWTPPESDETTINQNRRAAINMAISAFNAYNTSVAAVHAANFSARALSMLAITTGVCTGLSAPVALVSSFAAVAGAIASNYIFAANLATTLSDYREALAAHFPLTAVHDSLDCPV